MSEPLRVLGVDPERGFAGGETQVLALTTGLLRRGHRAELLCDPQGQLWRRARAAGVECRPLRIRNSVDLAAGLRLRAMLAARRYDVVHFHTARAHAMAPYARGRARALVVTRRMDYPPNRLFARWLYNRAVDGVAAISSGVADALLRAGVASGRIATIHSGVECARFAPPDATARQSGRAAFGLADDEVAIVAAGALVARKGY
ncbi:MAG TPA: glycosyltransferase family 4 protein, partial [Candidatus Binataceae bacterium]|nr:glycosyltransferase family 4 protein [Candidatus Binataceae bacterium]